MAEDVYTRPGPTNDIYQTLSRPNPGTRVQRNTAQHGDSGESKKNVYRAAAVCLGLMCLLLSAGIIGLLGVHNNNLVKHLDQLQLQTRHATEQNAKLQNSWDELQSRYTNLTEERYVLKTRLCEFPGWKKSVYGCYFISTERKTWEESRQYCRDRHSDLMAIRTKEDQDFVKNVNQRVWLGLTDREEEGRFKWVDGTPLTEPTFWNTGQPDNKGLAGDGEGDCVEFLNWANRRGWNDQACSDLNQWICEIVIY